MSERVCARCGFEFHPSDTVRHIGSYVIHSDGRCYELFRIHIGTLEAQKTAALAARQEAEASRDSAVKRSLTEIEEQNRLRGELAKAGERIVEAEAKLAMLVWQPISTAPKREFLSPMVDLWLSVSPLPMSFGMGDSWCVTEARWMNAGECADSPVAGWYHIHRHKWEQLRSEYVTHWRPANLGPESTNASAVATFTARLKAEGAAEALAELGAWVEEHLVDCYDVPLRDGESGQWSLHTANAEAHNINLVGCLLELRKYEGAPAMGAEIGYYEIDRLQRMVSDLKVSASTGEAAARLKRQGAAEELRALLTTDCGPVFEGDTPHPIFDVIRERAAELEAEP